VSERAEVKIVVDERADEQSSRSSRVSRRRYVLDLVRAELGVDHRPDDIVRLHGCRDWRRSRWVLAELARGRRSCGRPGGGSDGDGRLRGARRVTGTLKGPVVKGARSGRLLAGRFCSAAALDEREGGVWLGERVVPGGGSGEPSRAVQGLLLRGHGKLTFSRAARAGRRLRPREHWPGGRRPAIRKDNNSGEQLRCLRRTAVTSLYQRNVRQDLRGTGRSRRKAAGASVSARRKYCKPLTLCAGKADEQLTSSNLWQSESKTIYIELKGKLD